VTWETYPENPVLRDGIGAAWDGAFVSQPSVLYDGTQYHMWYSGYDGTKFRIGYATSSDGAVWNKHAENPVLKVGVAGSWDDAGVSSPSVLHDGTGYHMWYSGYDGTTMRIGYATSSDGLLWNKHASPVLDVEASGAWDAEGVSSPTVLIDGTGYALFYTGSDGAHQRIGYATSTDGMTWNKDVENPVLDVGPSGTLDDAGVSSPIVLYDGIRYCMFYTGCDGDDLNIDLAMGQEIPEETGPRVSSFSPADNAEDVSLDADLILTFDQSNITAGSGKVTIRNSSDHTTVETLSAGATSIRGDQVTIDPSENLSPGTGYYVLIDDNAFHGGSGKYYSGISDAQTWNFTTRYASFTATAGNNQVELCWEAHTEPDVYAYYLYRDTSSPASTLLDRVAAPDTFYVDTNVVAGTTYYYRITALDSAENESGFGEEVSATPWIYGDVSGNGCIMAFDATLILQETVDIIKLPDSNWPVFSVEVADVSGNGEISAWDASLVLQHVVDLIPGFPVEGGGSPKWVSSSREVHLGSAEALPDGSFEVPVCIDEMEGLLSGQIELSFDRGLFRAIQVAKSDRTEEVLFAAKIFEDRVKFSFAGAESRQGGGRIATIRFERIGGRSDGIAGITLRSVQLNEGHIAVSLPSLQTASKVPASYQLSQNFPNPFNPTTEIRYQLPEVSHVELVIYDLLGRKVQVLVDGFEQAGYRSVVWDAKAAASGIYLVRMEAGDFVAVRKMVVVR
ncbi:MAG: Ig-like domain-containing protein, partial [Candidatus Latescibacteria bacterium]|nr:Ig-like domain-containing protein [Candidatus Latescibacterota bacterium]